jgi:hypothetical protein
VKKRQNLDTERVAIADVFALVGDPGQQPIQGQRAIFRFEQAAAPSTRQARLLCGLAAAAAGRRPPCPAPLVFAMVHSTRLRNQVPPGFDRRTAAKIPDPAYGIADLL